MTQEAAITTELTSSGETIDRLRQWQSLLLLLPSILITVLFLFYPLAFIVVIRVTAKESFLTPPG
jgi:ABC-type sugar transport system permease subunit